MSIGRSLAWMGSGQVVALVSQFGAQVVLIRHLSLHDAGIYAVAFAVVSALSLVQTLGLQALIVRSPEITPALTRTAFTVNAIISVALAVVIAALAYLGAAFLGDPGVGRVLFVLAVTPLIAIFSFLPGAMMEREGRFREIALAGAAGSLAGAVATIALALNGFGYMSAAYAQWANTGLMTLLTIRFGRRHASLALGFASWRSVLDFGLQMLAVSGISNVGLRLSDVVLGRMLGLSALGVYNRASALNGFIWANVHLLIGRVLLVDFADVLRRGEPLRARYVQTVDIVTTLLWPVFAGFAIVGGPFILAVYGARWTPAALPLALLALASIIQVAITMTWELFAATGELRTQTRIEFWRTLFALGTFATGCTVGLSAAALARVADAVFALILYRPHLNRMTDTRFSTFVPIYARSAALTLVAIAPGAAVMAAHGWSPATPLAALGPAIAAGVLLWAGALVAVRHPVIGHAMPRIRRAGRG